ncbi:aldo/keto reductase [Saccharomonospora sp. NPDC046836]|uniref:aldo/keto reductase n=1 Tax=Saccharomonospora sp. NPDC046836 TaxID=3156921 RepID=UPI0033CCFDEC
MAKSHLVLGLGAVVSNGYGLSNRAGAREPVEVALQSGVTLIDTAAVYAGGESERACGTPRHAQGHLDVQQRLRSALRAPVRDRRQLVGS